MTTTMAEVSPQYSVCESSRAPNAQDVALFRLIMRRTLHSQWFGIGITPEGGGKASPRHRNTRHNPRPCSRRSQVTGTHFGVPDTWGRYARRHLAGEQALFELSRCDRRTARYTLDIDATESAVRYSDTSQLGRRIAAECWSINQPWVEPGRSYPTKQGAYTRFLVDWRGIAPQTRRLAETLVNRELRRRYPRDSRMGFHLDGLKGLTTYVEPNPRFDHDFAMSYEEHEGERFVNIAPLLDGHEANWVRPFDARRLLRLLGRSKVADLVAGLETQWCPVSRLDHYRCRKLFYGFGDGGVRDRQARIAFDPRLEEARRHFGTLVTAPCYGRPAEVQRLAIWHDQQWGRITWRSFIGILPLDQQQAIRQGWTSLGQRRRRPDCPVLMSGSAGNTDDAGYVDRGGASGGQVRGVVSTLRDRTRFSSDIEVMNSQDDDPIEQMRAANRVHMRQANGDIERTVALTLEWYEGPAGPATGMSTAEQDQRVDRIRRHTEKLAETFRPMQRGQGLIARISADNVVSTGEELWPLIPTHIRDFAIANHPNARSLTPRFLAGVYIAVVLGVISNDGNVSRRWIQTCLSAFGTSRSTTTIACATAILHMARLIVMMRDYSAPETRTDRGQCRNWQVNRRRFWPGWASALESSGQGQLTAFASGAWMARPAA